MQIKQIEVVTPNENNVSRVIISMCEEARPLMMEAKLGSTAPKEAKSTFAQLPLEPGAWVLSGRPNSGKTTEVLRQAGIAARRGKTFVYLSGSEVSVFHLSGLMKTSWAVPGDHPHIVIFDYFSEHSETDAIALARELADQAKHKNITLWLVCNLPQKAAA